MTSNEGRSSSEEKSGVDLNPILVRLGGRGRYQMVQLTLNCIPSFLFPIALLESVFIGYQPDYQCSQVDNVTQLETYLPDHIFNFTLHDVQYRKCTIDVIFNTSGASSAHSLPCVAGVNFSMPSYTSFVTEWSLVCDKAGLAQLTQTGLFAGVAVGSMVFSTLADRYGRKKICVVCAPCMLLTAIITAWVPSYYLFLAGKITVGFFLRGMIMPAFTMFVELFPQKWRHVASVMDSFIWSVACVFMAIGAYCLQGVPWRYVSLINAALFAYSLSLPWILDESLRWLLATGRITEAEKILKKACKMNGKDFEEIRPLLQKQIVIIDNINHPNETGPISEDEGDTRKRTQASNEEKTEEVRNDGKVNEGTGNAEMIACDYRTEGTASGSHQCDLPRDSVTGNDGIECSNSDPLGQQEDVFSTKYTILDLFRHRAVFVPFLVVILVWMTCNLYYLVTVLGSAKLSGNRILNFGLINLLTLPVDLVSIFLMRKINRRPLASVFSILVGMFLLLSVGLVAFGGGQAVTLTLATVAQYVGMLSVTGSFNLLFVYYMEVFPTAMRVIGTGTASTVIKLTDMAAPFLLLWADVTPWAPGVLVGCLCCLAGLSIWLLPETRHRKLPTTIEEIESWKQEKRIVML